MFKGLLALAILMSFQLSGAGEALKLNRFHEGPSWLERFKAHGGTIFSISEMSYDVGVVRKDGYLSFFDTRTGDELPLKEARRAFKQLGGKIGTSQTTLRDIGIFKREGSYEFVNLRNFKVISPDTRWNRPQRLINFNPIMDFRDFFELHDGSFLEVIIRYRFAPTTEAFDDYDISFREVYPLKF